MGANGNPLGSRKVVAASRRILKEKTFQDSIQVFTPANSPNPEHGKIAEGGLPMPAVLKIAEKHPGVTFFSKNQEISPDAIRASLSVIKTCEDVVKRYGPKEK